jgi:hypothetical protein
MGRMRSGQASQADLSYMLTFRKALFTSTVPLPDICKYIRRFSIHTFNPISPPPKGIDSPEFLFLPLEILCRSDDFYPKGIDSPEFLFWLFREIL